LLAEAFIFAQGNSDPLVLGESIQSILKNLKALLPLRYCVRVSSLGGGDIISLTADSQGILNRTEPLLSILHSDEIQRLRDCDPVEPGGEFGVSSESGDRTVCLKKDFLGHVFRVLAVVEETVADIQNQILMELDEIFKRSRPS